MEEISTQESLLEKTKEHMAYLKQLLKDLAEKNMKEDISPKDLGTYINLTSRYLKSLEETLNKIEMK